MTLGPHYALPLELRSVNAKPLEVSACYNCVLLKHSTLPMLVTMI